MRQRLLRTSGSQGKNQTVNIAAATITGVLLAILMFVVGPGAGFNELSLTRWLPPLVCMAGAMHGLPC
jgi:hypothetical protein